MLSLYMREKGRERERAKQPYYNFPVMYYTFYKAALASLKNHFPSSGSP